MKLALIAGAALFSLASNAVAACNHPYFPSAANTTWVYQLKGVTSQQYTQRIAAASGSSFTVQNDFGKFKVENTLECAADGSLVQTRYGGLSGGAVNAQVETVSYKGAAFPPAAQWVIGGAWTYSYVVKITSSANGQAITQNGTVTAQSKILAEETVKVPAGSFKALKVAQTITINLTMTMGGRSTPINNVTTTTAWYARDVGLVKSLTETGGVKSTSELVSFKRP